MANKKNSVAICLEYKGKTYVSDFTQESNESILKITEMVKLAINGSLSHLNFQSGNETYYFPANILQNSVISIVTN